MFPIGLILVSTFFVLSIPNSKTHPITPVTLQNGIDPLLLTIFPNPTTNACQISVSNSTHLSTTPLLNVTYPNSTWISSSLDLQGPSTWGAQFSSSQEGIYNVTITALNGSGYLLQVSDLLVIDRTPPVVTVLSFEIDFAFIDGRVLRIMIRNNTESVNLSCIIKTPSNQTLSVIFDYFSSCQCWSGYIETQELGTFWAYINATDTAGNQQFLISETTLGPNRQYNPQEPDPLTPSWTQLFIDLVPLLTIGTFLYLGFLGILIFYIKSPDVD